MSRGATGGPPGGRPAAGTPGDSRRRLYAAALEHAEGLPDPATAAAWLTAQGLLAVQDVLVEDLPTAATGAAAREAPRTPADGTAELRSLLAAAARRNLAANLLRTHRFQQVADALAPLPLCPLKGIFLLDTVYAADPQHRVLADLDLLVPPGDAAEAVKRLEALGYREGAASRRAAPGWHERVLDDGRVPVEIHTRLGVKHGPHTTWDQVVPVPATVHGRPVHRLDDAATLVHLVVHFVKHGPFVRLGWVEDVLRWIEATGNDGAEALRVARRLGAHRSFVAGVRALATVAGEGLLPGVPRSLPGPGGALLALHERWVWPELAGGRAGNRPGSRRPARPLACGAASSPWRRNLSALLLADRPADALRFLAAKGRELTSRRAAGRAEPSRP